MSIMTNLQTRKEVLAMDVNKKEKKIQKKAF